MRSSAGVEVGGSTPEQAHPGVVLWMWATFYLDHDRLPQQRVLVRFDYPTLPRPGSRCWLLIERGDAEICEKYPGSEEHLIVIVEATRWHLPAGTWARSPGITRCALVRSSCEVPGRWPEPSPSGIVIMNSGRNRCIPWSRQNTLSRWLRLLLPERWQAGRPGSHIALLLRRYGDHHRSISRPF